MSTYNSTNMADVKPNLNRISEYRHAKKRLFNVLLGLANTLKEIYISIEELAKQIGCTPRHTKRLLKEIQKDHGFTSRRNSGWNQTCNYFIHEIFYIPEIRSNLSKVFSNLAQWGVASFERARAYFKKNVTLLYRKTINNIKEWTCQDDIALIKKLNNQKRESICKMISVLQKLSKFKQSKERKKVFTIDKSKLRPGQFTPGFNTNYYFRRTEAAQALEIAEYGMENHCLTYRQQISLKPEIHIIQAQKQHEFMRRQETERLKMLKDKEYSNAKLEEMRKINEENKKNKGLKGFFANLIFPS